MVLTAKEIAAIVGGNIEGKAESAIQKVAKLEEADGQSLCFFSNPKYEQQLYQTKAAIVLVNKDFELKKPVDFTLIKTDNAYYAFCVILDKYFNPNEHLTGIEDYSHIHESAQIGEGVYIGANAYVSEGVVIGNGTKIYPGVYLGKNVRVGRNTILFPGVVIYSQCQIGSNCIVHSGTVIGSDGFGFAPVGGKYLKIPQIGNVIIEDDVEIGSNCSIDRATMGSTIIKQGTKLDNLIQVAHNAEIGMHTVIASQAGVSGSTKIGAHCMIGGQSGFVGHIHVADGTGVGAQSGISKSIEEPNTQWMGSPAQPIKEHFKSLAGFKNLPDLIKRINELEKIVAQITQENS